MNVVCEEARSEHCATFIEEILAALKDNLGDNRFAQIAGVIDFENANKHPRREGQYLHANSGSQVVSALQASIMGDHTSEGMIVIASPKKSSAHHLNNHFRAAPKPYIPVHR